MWTLKKVVRFKIQQFPRWTIDVKPPSEEREAHSTKVVRNVSGIGPSGIFVALLLGSKHNKHTKLILYLVINT